MCKPPVKYKTRIRLPKKYRGSTIKPNKEFLDFLIQVFKTLNPGSKFVNSWHIKLILEYLKNIEGNKINRLIINIPPRSLKSTCISVAWPAWLLGHDP